MNQSFSQIQKLTQSQTLTPAQLQTMRLLQASSQELEQQLKQALQENPVLEMQSGMEVLAGNPIEDSLQKGNFDDEHAAEHDENLADTASENMQGDAQPEDYFYNTWNADRDEKRQYFFNSLTVRKSMQESLLEQAEDLAGDRDTPLFLACQEVIGNLDDAGYLRASDEEIAAGAATDIHTARRAVQIIRSLTPAGIGGRDLREVLLLQLERSREKGSLAWDIADRFLEDLARNRIVLIAKELDADVQEIQEAAARIRQLDPLPGHALTAEAAPVVVPEVEIYRDGQGEWRTRLSGEAFPTVTVSPQYLELQGDKSLPREDRTSINKYIENGRQLIHSLEYRKSTIEKIAEALIQLQGEYLEKGDSAMKPLVMGKVADMLQVHETTISRAISNKYLRTPWGVRPFKYFFTAGFEGEDGEEVSSRAVKNKIAAMVKAENPAKPLSDQKLSDLLAAEGLTVARRTVAKYREEEGIPAASLRRIHS